jgi:hypothetical protein
MVAAQDINLEVVERFPDDIILQKCFTASKDVKEALIGMR